MEFSSPNTLAGVLLSYRDDNVEASYKGLSFSVPKSALPLKAIISSLIDVVDTTAELPEISGEEKDGEILVEGELEQGKYTLKMDKTGVLIGFSMSNLNLEIIFTDFQENGSGMTETTRKQRRMYRLKRLFLKVKNKTKCKVKHQLWKKWRKHRQNKNKSPERMLFSFRVF